MPRRKGHGIPPTKRVKQPDAISRSAPLKNKLYNEIPVVGVKEEPLQMTVNAVPIKPEPILSDALHSKYLHKKFKKMASTLLPEDTNNVLNGTRFKRVSDFINEDDRVLSPPKTEVPSANTRVTSPPAGRYICSYCKLACAKPSVLQKHIRAHTNERPYPCLPCGFAFKTKSNLYKHCRSRAHAAKLEETGEKPPVFDGEEAPTSEEDDSRSNISNAASTTSKTDDPDSKDEMPKSIYKPKYRFIDQPLLNAQQSEKSDDRKENSRSPPKLHLKIPVPNSSPFVSTPSPFTSGSSPSPDVIHRHISKLISENQAIVETNDPFWTKKFLQRANSNDNSSSSPLSTSPSPSEVKKMGRLTSGLEGEDQSSDKSPPKHSKLALALLRPQTSPSPADIGDAQPLNLSTSSKDLSLAQNRKRSYSEGFPEQVIKTTKSQVSIIPPKIKNNSVQDFRRFSSFADNHSASLLNHIDIKKEIMGNPQNPEGSIIKDLLLKARASGSNLMCPNVDATNIKPLLSLTPPVSDDRAYSPSSQLMCHLSKEPVGYRHAESLEFHQHYQCKGNDSSSRSSLNSPSPKLDNHHSGSPYRKSSPMVIAPSHPSPGPHLGSTPLVECYRTRSPLDSDASPVVLKKRKFDTGAIETRVISASTLRTLEELSKSPMRSNLHMFGGELKIIDAPVEAKAIRLDSSNRVLSKPPSDVPTPKKIIVKDEESSIEAPSNVVVKIAKQALHSGGSILQVPHKSGVAESSVSHMHDRSLASHFQDPKPMMMSMVTSNLTGMGSTAHLPFIPFTSILSETTGINPLTNITAYNPLTLPPAPLIPPISPGMGMVHSPYSSGIVTIMHGGKEIPYVPGMPGPHSLLANHAMPVYSSKLDSDIKFPKSSERRSIDQEQISRSMKNDKPVMLSNHSSAQSVPIIKVTGDAMESTRKRPTEESLHSSPVSPTTKRSQTLLSEASVEVSSEKRFLRPTSLPLKPGTFVPKRQQVTPVLSLVSPETPRPRKSYGQLYLNGHAYTYLGLKCSTRMFFCTLNKPQPLYVPLSPEHNKVSMYSNWKVCTEADPNPFGLDPGRAMGLYDSRHRPATYTLARGRTCEAVTHSSYWTSRSRPGNSDPHLSDKEGKEGEAVPKRVKIFAGGFESNEDYIYVRGRGRGRYVCEECGIRCKKPSMLKKHIRTHTDVRPYTCTHCMFSFKTKGNLTKHMKSKAHYKKCVDLGISPVPTTVDDSCVDEAALAHQQALRENQGVDPEESEEDEEDEEEDTEDEEDDEEDVDGEGEGEDWQAARSLLTLSETIQTATQRQHASAGLVAASARPFTYPYSFTHLAQPPQHTEPQTPTLTAISAQREREKVSQNTGLAREVQGDVKTTRGSVEESKGNVGDKGVAARYYFPSSQDTGDSGSESGNGRRAKESTPIDLSNKATEKSPRVSEAALLLALCSTMERLPISSTTVSEDSTLLQAYLTERAVQDSRIKQQYKHRPAADLPVTSGLNKHRPAADLPVTSGLNINAAKENARGILAQTSSDARKSDAAPVTSGSPNKPQAEFLPPSSGPSPSYVSLLEDGRSMCNICNKVFSKPSQLRLHVNIHYFERPFRCEACAVSFRTKGHLQKHMRSVSHLNKVSMNSTFGTATTTNPRPFKCDDCKIAFRIHGHLAKHLRSKMHIMKLECLGKLPFGTYAEMERSGINMNDIDTTDCENSLESLQILAQKLYEKDPSKLGQWEPSEMMPHHAMSSGETSSEGEEEDMPPSPTPTPAPLKCVINIRNAPTPSSVAVVNHKGPKHKPDDDG